jgi:acetyltransferase-like isoleucine patch superfamily enzyme
VGEGAVIGSNVWITKSVAPYAVVVLDNPPHKVKNGPTPRAQQEAIMYHI